MSPYRKSRNARTAQAGLHEPEFPERPECLNWIARSGMPALPRSGISMQADAVHFAVCDNEQVTEPGTRNHGADGFVKFTIEQAAAADREDLAFLFVVDINLVTCQVYIRVLHGKVYAACFFAAFVIETQGIMAVSFCIGRKDADKAVSAENAQKKLSLLAGREGETIAASCVTLMDDPLLPGGFASAPFDGEGSACRTKAVIENGVLKTLLHSRSNFFFRPGEKDLDSLLADMGEGLLITELGGLHAGANPVSGDFSLIAKGFRVAGGKQGLPVEQITVAGNFYQLLKNIQAVGSDLEFKGSGIGSPSVDIGSIHVAGK